MNSAAPLSKGVPRFPEKRKIFRMILKIWDYLELGYFLKVGQTWRTQEPEKQKES